MTTELDGLSKKLLEDKLNRGNDRAFGTGISTFV